MHMKHQHMLLHWLLPDEWIYGTARILFILQRPESNERWMKRRLPLFSSSANQQSLLSAHTPKKTGDNNESATFSDDSRTPQFHHCIIGIGMHELGFVACAKQLP